jgi:hypothetical protein
MNSFIKAGHEVKCKRKLGSGLPTVLKMKE